MILHTRHPINVNTGMPIGNTIKEVFNVPCPCFVFGWYSARVPVSLSFIAKKLVITRILS